MYDLTRENAGAMKMVNLKSDRPHARWHKKEVTTEMENCKVEPESRALVRLQFVEIR